MLDTIKQAVDAQEIDYVTVGPDTPLSLVAPGRKLVEAGRRRSGACGGASWLKPGCDLSRCTNAGRSRFVRA